MSLPLNEYAVFTDESSSSPVMFWYASSEEACARSLRKHWGSTFICKRLRTVNPGDVCTLMEERTRGKVFKATIRKIREYDGKMTGEFDWPMDRMPLTREYE